MSLKRAGKFNKSLSPAKFNQTLKSQSSTRTDETRMELTQEQKARLIFMNLLYNRIDFLRLKLPQITSYE